MTSFSSISVDLPDLFTVDLFTVDLFPTDLLDLFTTDLLDIFLDFLVVMLLEHILLNSSNILESLFNFLLVNSRTINWRKVP